MIRGAIALAATSTAVAGLIVTGHHIHKRPVPAGSAKPVPVPSARTSRGEVRPPLHVVKPAVSPGKTRHHPSKRVARSATRSGGFYADVTEYCATGNRNAAGRWPQLGDVAVADRSIPFGTRVTIGSRSYRVEDWIGWGSQFDIFGGDDEDCEQRAMEYGRRHLRVVVDR